VNREEVTLAVPALPEYVRLARLTAAGVASRLGFSYDDVEDLRIAVDELCYLLVGAEGRAGGITLRFAVDDDALVIVGEGTARSEPVEFAELSEQLLSALVDEYRIGQDDAAVTIRLVRRRRGGAG
jgi:serine/threonine-protein kinase RsbW